MSEVVTIDCMCKDCRFSKRKSLGSTILYCYYWDYEHGMSPNAVSGLGFCSNGELRK